MGLFSSRKRQSYQGFSKYTNELQYHEANVAGLPNNGIDRTASLSNSAGSAALAALRLHSQPTAEPVRQSPANGRTKSLTNRSNSLKTYTYHPKGSYVPGQASIPNSRRYSSMTANTKVPNYQNLKPPASNRLSSLNQNSYPVDEDDEGETVITTQTTKVVDNQGRVQSITTKTIKTLPDGSNIIETTTKNISRGNSRNNSLRNNSMLSLKHENYNLQKIDEDLHDFEYNYELDNAHINNVHLDTRSALNNTRNEPQEAQFHENAELLKLNVDTSPRSGSPKSDIKPLRSILKNSPKVNSDTFEEQQSNQLQPPIEFESQHPYKTLGTPLTEPPKFKVPALPKTDNGNINGNGKLGAKTGHFSPNKESNRSVTSANSIKFDDHVETIPIYDTDFNRPKVSNQDLYSKAMQVAMEKVYGSAEGPAAKSAESPETYPDNAPNVIPQKLISKKDKQDKKLAILGHSGVNDNYIYENHHRDFKVHSLRDGEAAKETTHKERAKLEKKQQKEYEKQLKEQEKQQKLELKEKQKAEALAKKQAEKEVKKSPKSPKRGLFRRRRSEDTTINSINSNPVSITPRIVEPVNEPMVEPVKEPVVELVKKRVVEPVNEPIVEPIAEPIVEPTEQNSKPIDSTPVETSIPIIQPVFTIPVGTIPERSIPQPSMPSPSMPEPDLQEHSVTEPDLHEHSVTQSKPEPIPLESKGINQPEILKASKSNISQPIVSTPVITTDGVNDDVLKASEDADETIDNNIPRPVLNEVVSDADDSGLVSDLDEYEDVNSPTTFKKPEFESKDLSVPIDSGEDDATILEEKIPQVVHIFKAEEVSDKDTKGVETAEIAQSTTLENAEKEITPPHQYLADLIKIGKADSTDDSISQPNLQDVDTSSKFSADLSAAIKKITDSDDEMEPRVNTSGIVEPLNQSSINDAATVSRSTLSMTGNQQVADAKEAGAVPEISKVKEQKDEHVYEDKIASKSKTKTKKPSKFKERILKLFVNSYEKK